MAKPSNTGQQKRVRVADIKVGARARRDLGDIDELKASIIDVGLLHPLVLDQDHSLIAGARRLAAVRKLGWVDVPAHIFNVDDLTRYSAELQENTARKELTPTEKLALAERIEKQARADAKARQKAGGGIPGSGKLPQPVDKSRDIAASNVGMSGRTYEKAKAVVQAAKEDPENFGDLPALMDAKGKIDPAYNKLMSRKQAAYDAQAAQGPTTDARQDAARARLESATADAVLKLRRGLLKLDPERIANILTDDKSLQDALRDVGVWSEKYQARRNARKNLKLVGQEAQA